MKKFGVKYLNKQPTHGLARFFLFVLLHIAILGTFLQTADLSETLFTSVFKFRYLL